MLWRCHALVNLGYVCYYLCQFLLLVLIEHFKFVKGLRIMFDEPRLFYRLMLMQQQNVQYNFFFRVDKLNRYNYIYAYKFFFWLQIRIVLLATGVHVNIHPGFYLCRATLDGE